LGNQALFNREVPWVYTEIIFGLDAAGKSGNDRGRICVDSEFNFQTNSSTGTTSFNDVRMFVKDYTAATWTYSERKHYPIAGQVRGFIMSAPENTPGLQYEPPPSIQ
jgi:hypothetical protein